ncbi:glycosyltransferase family 10 domain-containing protein [Parabacteroides provencensis]|uniref:glycosyltransferase family 10 domain-containing protein n=1 Tax=Parabacteroides provencensis TaxID=1944636 RepID=UPI000C14FE7D|nr:glycosyltransferase family 10 [Parabacteroides provencensis]
MKNINILSNEDVSFVFKQYSENIFPSEFKFFYNSKENIIWDLVIVYEEIDTIYTLKCKKGATMFFSGEPPICKIYSKKFTEQFSHIISSHRNLLHPSNHLLQQSLLWYFGYNFEKKIVTYNFDDLIDLPNHKTKNISFITSSRAFLPGHKARLRFLKEVQQRYESEIDFFGAGISYVADKADAILPYRFSICIENCNIPDYWSEKIADAILGYSIPIYCGCNNIEDYFPQESFIKLDINDIDSSLSIIEYVIKNAEAIYKEKYPYLLKAREKLLYQYNIFSSAIEYYNRFLSKKDDIEEICIKPSSSFKDNLVKTFLLKLKRFCGKRVSVNNML